MSEIPSEEATTGLEGSGVNENKEVKQEDTLEDLAVKELLQEAKRGKERAKDLGSLGWQTRNIPKTNKRFLRNTLVSTLRHPYGSERKPKYRGQPQKDTYNYLKDKNNHRKRKYSSSPDNERNKDIDYGDFDAYKYKEDDDEVRINSDLHLKHVTAHWSSEESDLDNNSGSDTSESHGSRKKRRKKSYKSSQNGDEKALQSKHKSKHKSSKSRHKHKNMHKSKHKDKHKEKKNGTRS